MNVKFRPRLVFALALLAVLAATLAGLGGTQLHASAGTQIFVTAGNAQGPGSTGQVTVAVNLAPQDTLSEFEITVAYDPDILEIEDADSVTLNPRWDPPTGLPLLIDVSVPGFVRVHSTTGDPCPPGGTCGLFSFSWVALANGVSSVAVMAFTLTGTESGTPGILSGVGTIGTDVQVGAAPTATPTPTTAATGTPTATTVPPSPTSTSTAPPTATSTAPAVPLTQAPGGPAASPSPSGDSTVAGATAQAPSSGNGLAGGPGSELAQGAMLAFIVAALLAFGWIMSTLRRPGYAPAMAADTRRSPRTREEIEMEMITDYLQTMEALGMASSDIDLDEERRG